MQQPSTKRVPLICSGHSRPVPDFAYSSITEDGFFIVSACLDGKPMLRKGENGDWIGTFMGHKGAVWSAHINNSATLIATGSADYSAKLWDAVSGEEKATFNHSKIVKTVHFSKEDKLLTGGVDKILRVFDLSKTSSDPLQLTHNLSIKMAQWLGPNLIATTCGDASLHIWDIRSGKEEKNETLKSPISSLEVSLDGKNLVTVGGKEAIVWEIEGITEKAKVSTNFEINSGSLSRDGKSLVLGGQDFYVHLMDMTASGKEIDTYKGHHGPVHCVRWSPDESSTFASSSEDGTIRLWVTPQFAKELPSSTTNGNSTTTNTH